MQSRSDTSVVDAKKLGKAEAKLQQKQERRDGVKAAPLYVPVLKQASASQVMSKKDSKMDAKGQSRSMDIRIENFDVAFGDKVLLLSADILLASGRRYGLCGRNGLGEFGSRRSFWHFFDLTGAFFGLFDIFLTYWIFF